MSALRLRVLCALCGVLLAACFGGQTGQESRAEAPADCALERMPLQPNEATSLGFTAAQLEMQLAPELTSSMQWSRMSTSTTLTLMVREVRSRALVRSTNGACPDAIELDALVAVSTEDGLLDEQIEATISAQSLDMWTLNGEVALDAIAGELDATVLNLDVSNWLAPRLSLRLWGPEIHGQITLHGEDPNPGDDISHASPAIAELPSP